jgi:hypothetical protein
MITFLGMTLCSRDWDYKLGFRQGTVANRMTKLGWSQERAVTTPKMH